MGLDSFARDGAPAAGLPPAAAMEEGGHGQAREAEAEAAAAAEPAAADDDDDEPKTPLARLQREAEEAQLRDRLAAELSRARIERAALCEASERAAPRMRIRPSS